MIDHKHRFIFIHQRKVAGMAIAHAWGYSKIVEKLAEEDRGYALNRAYVPDESDFHKYNNGARAMAWPSRSEEERKYFVFSAVRNPFDRLISSWKFLICTRDRTLLDVLQNMPMDWNSYEHLSRPQVDILRDRNTGQLVTDDLIRYETLQEDFDRISDKVGKPRVRLPEINVSVRDRGYRQYFDPLTRKLAERYFADDLQTFGYEF